MYFLYRLIFRSIFEQKFFPSAMVSFFNTGRFADGIWFCFLPRVTFVPHSPRAIIIKPFQGFRISKFIIPYSLTVLSGGLNRYFVIICLFRPQWISFFNPGRFADGIWFCLFTRGYIRSSFTPGYYNQTPSGF
jgi:hypothetical protein